MTEEELQKIKDTLPAWTEEFVQREWYKEFLQHFPLSKYPSLLEVYPKVAFIVQDCVDKYCLGEVLKDVNNFYFDLQCDILNLYYNDFEKIIRELNEKYDDIVFDDLCHKTSCAGWFKNNIEINVKLDRKYNI